MLFGWMKQNIQALQNDKRGEFVRGWMDEIHLSERLPRPGSKRHT
jgi:hypothetical protein